MLKYIWAFLIVAGLITGIAAGNGEAVSAAVTDGAKTAAELCLSMLGAYALYMGLLGVLDDAGAVKSLARRAAAPLRFIFPGLKNQKAKSYIALNMVANFLGMGNAATPFGLKGMQELQKENKNKERASDHMCMFAVLNTASVQLIPLSVIALRSACGSADASWVTLPTLVVSVVTAVFTVLLARVCAMLGRRP